MHKEDPFAKREAEKYSNPIPSREFILSIFNNTGMPLGFNQLKKELMLSGEQDGSALRKRLRAMVRDGQLDKIHKSYCLKGFINKSRTIDWSLEVNNKTTKKTAGKLFEVNGFTYVIPFFSKDISQDILIPSGNAGDAKVGDGVIVEVIMPVFKWADPMGKVLKVLGKADDRNVMTSMAIQCLAIPAVWPMDVKKDLTDFQRFDINSVISSRVDLRKLPFVTIDGEDAKDFDDAVFCQPNKRSGWDLYVAIADVSYYIQSGSSVDKQALLRGNSVYFSGKVIPMLPELFSNELCSLRPHADRLSLVCQMHINDNGRLTKYTFYEAIICSKARLTYNLVSEILETKKNTRSLDQDILKNLQELNNLFVVLQQQRHERGAIEFESTESKMCFNKQGEVIDIKPMQRTVAHKIIEECMLCANVATAKLLQKHNLLSIYRVHEGPTSTKLLDLKAFLQSVGLSLDNNSSTLTPKDYSILLQKISARTDADVIQMILLRSMCQAVYSADNIGHFGLAYPAYTHFTSPIRRYTDLLVHRHIKSILNNNISTSQLSVEKINEIAEHCSMTERRADDATREVIKACKCRYLSKYIGHMFLGIISGVTKFGLFVELKDLYIDGLIHINSLGFDYFIHDPISHKLIGEKSGVTYSLGMELKVRVSKVDLDRRRIDFVLDQEDKKLIVKKNKAKKSKLRKKLQARIKVKKQKVKKITSGKKQ